MQKALGELPLKLFLMRHGSAEDQAVSGHDADRALTAPGEARVRSAAEVLEQAGEEPLVIATSPLIRAVQTAEIVAAVTKLRVRGGHVEVRRELAPGGDAPALVARLASSGIKRLMVVGHEPDLTQMTKTLIADLQRPFEKAMVIGVHVGIHGEAARLRFVLDPKSLRFDPDARRPR